MGRVLVLVTLLLNLAVVPGLMLNSSTTIGYKNVAYFANWAIYERNFSPQNLEANALTHVLYAFANVRPETGEVYLSDTWSDVNKPYSTDSWNSDVGSNVYGCVKQLFLLKKRNRKLKTLLSIGGWSYSVNFAKPASTPAGRIVFANSAVQLLQDLGFDGLDVDWEYPQDQAEANDLASLLAEIRKHLDAYSQKNAHGKRLLLTVASPARLTNYVIRTLPAIDAHVDFWNVMAYDYTSLQDTVAGHNANWNSSSSDPNSTPYNSNQAIAEYIKSGVPASKIVLGMPLYGRSFANTDGPGHPFSGVGQGTWEPGVYDYKVLPQPGASINTDKSIAAAWSYDPMQRLMVSFDTPDITARKTEFIKADRLGGAMWWESSGDKKGVDSLISTFVNGIGGVSALDHSENLLNYSASKYDNLRAGMPDE